MNAITAKERPILFSGEMVRAILEGRKTMTRRVVKPQPACGCHYEINGARNAALHLADIGGDFRYVPPTPRSTDHRLLCPFGGIGDRLWVRERWGVAESSFKPYACTINYFADNASKTVPGHTGIQYVGKNLSFVWRPSIHMPRWASRITLEITGVRVERLQDINREDARAEGIPEYLHELTGTASTESAADLFRNRTTVENFTHLWDSLNAKRSYGWDANPWVWVVAFRRVGI